MIRYDGQLNNTSPTALLRRWTARLAGAVARRPGIRRRGEATIYGCGPDSRITLRDTTMADRPSARNRGGAPHSST